VSVGYKGCLRSGIGTGQHDGSGLGGIGDYTGVG